ncbi:MAG TPA: LysM peptidoglycan-binding domain-containing protein [Clostridiales bacterium]|nr:LysM peptidoglycan-binding domain-containing protein [Clostridiales bacterium]
MSILKKSARFVITVALTFMILAGTAFGATYTVQSGDSLYKIGTLFDTTANVIRSDNKLSGDLIYPGQKLYVRARTHTVKSGDTLSLIAGWYGVSLADLRKANNKWDNMIYPGQVLNIPGAGTSASGSNSSKAAISYTKSELDLLARLVRAEAEGEPYAAKVGVAAVVLNRVKSSDFPNTISSVIYEVSSNGYYQFTPVENGMINQPARQQDIDAALEALNGSDPSNGALFYFDDSATNKWLWSKPIKAWIGRMVFVY